ncbi:hypothetical protein Tco_0945550 [Tanacetum coccineum]
MCYGGICYHCNYDTNPNSLNFSDYPLQPRYETNICELCGNDAHFGYDCSLQVPFDYNQNPCFEQSFDNNFPLTSPQQYLYCENYKDPHETFQCQPLNQNFYEPNSSGFDQFQPPQFLINYSPQETSKEILQAREDLMEAIQAFLKEFDHILPEEKCMALLLAEERFFKIKQVMEEEQNQPEDMQELLLKLMNDLQVLKEIQQVKEKPAAQSFTPYGNFSMIDDVFGEIKHALADKQYRQEDIQELMSKLLEVVRNINEELSEYINCPSWNRPIFYDDDDDEYTIIYRKPKAITPVLLTREPDNSLSMGDEHLDTIPETESDEIIKSSVKNLVPIPSELEGIFNDTCDVPVRDDSFTFDALNDNYEILSDSNDDDTSSDDDDFEDIEYVSIEEVNVDQEEKEFDLEDILLIQDVEPDQGGLTNIVMDEISDNSTNDPLLELPEFESFHIDLYDDPSSPRPPPEPPDVEICFNFEPDTPVINNFDKLNKDEYFDPGGVKTPFLIPASPLRASGISSRWNFHML